YVRTASTGSARTDISTQHQQHRFHPSFALSLSKGGVERPVVCHSPSTSSGRTASGAIDLNCAAGPPTFSATASPTPATAYAAPARTGPHATLPATSGTRPAEDRRRRS